MKQAPNSLWKLLAKTLISLAKPKGSVYDECSLYSQDLIVLVHVGDILILGQKNKINEFHQVMRKVFKVVHSPLNEEMNTQKVWRSS